MRLRTERRLILALLLCSLLPLAVLGGLGAVGFTRLGAELRSAQRGLRRAEARETAVAEAFRASDRASALLQRALADVRSLAALPPSPETYEEFCRTHLAPVRTASGRDAPVVWPPLYRQAGYAPRPPKTGFISTPFTPPAPVPPEPGPVGDLPRSGRIRVVAERTREGQVPRVERLVAEVWRSEVPDLGRVWAELDLRHLEHALGTTPGRTGLVLFELDGTPCWLGSLPPPAEVVARLTAPTAFGPEPMQAGAVVWVEGNGQGFALVAFNPFPDSTQTKPAGFVLAATAPVPPTAADRALEDLARRYAGYAGLLTLATGLVIAVVAVLVARRTVRPWVRLSERLSAFVPERVEKTDDVSAIADTVDHLAQEARRNAGRLRETESRLGEFLEMTPDGIGVFDASGHILHANRALCQMLRRPPRQMQGLTASEILEEPRAWPALLARLRQSNRLRNYELPLRRADGSRVDALWSARLALMDGREQVEAVIRDVSEIKEAQERDREKTETLFRVYGELHRAREALRQAYQEAEETVNARTKELEASYQTLQATERVRTEFLMQMSHELRTPLNCIIGYSEAMIQGLDGPLTPDQAHSLARIADSGRRLLRLIENILDLSRIEAGRLEIAPCPVRVEVVAEAVLHQARTLVGDRPVALELRAHPHTPQAWADPDRLTQVLFNLVGNAIKFTSQGRVRVEIRPTGAGRVEVGVKDTGPGIAPDDRERIFQKFVRGAAAGADGAGLGLAICRELVERMGGTIWVESEPGQGSVFRFVLPAADGAIDADGRASV